MAGDPHREAAGSNRPGRSGASGDGVRRGNIPAGGGDAERGHGACGGKNTWQAMKNDKKRFKPIWSYRFSSSFIVC
jgi:hypothetical protein